MAATEGYAEMMDLVRPGDRHALNLPDALRRGLAAAALCVIAWQAGDGRAADLEEAASAPRGGSRCCRAPSSCWRRSRRPCRRWRQRGSGGPRRMGGRR